MHARNSRGVIANSTRRDFLKTSAVAGASLAGGLDIARAAHADGDETIFATRVIGIE